MHLEIDVYCTTSNIFTSPHDFVSFYRLPKCLYVSGRSASPVTSAYPITVAGRSPDMANGC